MAKKEPFKTDKPLYDYSIIYDYSKLPDELKQMIVELESYDESGDWYHYDIILDELDITAKSYWRMGIITEYDYKIILMKYGWIYD